MEKNKFLEFTNNIIEKIDSRSYNELILKSNQYSSTLSNNLNKNIIIYLKNNILESVLDYYQYLKSENEITGESRTERIESYFNMLDTPEFIDAFFSRYNMIEEIIKNSIKNISDLYLNVLNDYNIDKSELNFIFESNFSDLVNISLPEGDVHDGKAVVVVEFKSGSLVYKPRNMYQERVIESVISLISERNKKKKKFKIPKYLRGDTHSWQEFIKYKECDSLSQVHDFYYRIGSYLAVFYTFNTNDLHYENLICNGEHPIFFDLETLVLCQAKLDSNLDMYIAPFDVINTGILPIRNSEGLFDVNLSAIFTGTTSSKKIIDTYLIEDEKDDWIYKSEYVNVNGGKNLCKINGKEVNPWLVENDIIEGFSDAFQIVKENKNIILNIINKNKKKLTIRQLLRPTYVYAKFIKASLTPNVLMDSNKFEEVFNILSKNFKKGNFGFLRVESEVRDLRKGYIPSFFNRFTDTNLYSGNDIICENYFSESPINIVKNSLDNLTLEKMESQKRLIKLALLSLQDYNEFNQEHNFEKLRLIDLNNETLQSQLELYVSNLKNYFIKLPNNIYYMQFPYLTEQGFGVQISKEEFYQYGGMVLFLMMYSKYHDDKVYSLAKGALDYLIEKNSNKKDLDTKKEDFSFYYGKTGLLYLTYNFYKAFNNDKYFEISKNIAEDILENYSNKTLSKEHDLDFIEGLPSVISVLCKINSDSDYKLFNKNSLLVIIEKYIKLINQCEFEKNDASLSHGLIGICLSLSYLYKDYRDDIYLELMNTLKSFLNDFIKENNSISWCRGLSGIILANKLIKDNTYGLFELITDEKSIMRKVISKVNDSETFDLCLCHGIYGFFSVFDYVLNKDTELYHDFDKLKEKFMIEINSIEWFKNSGAEYEGFMMGSSGIAYTMLGYIYDIPCPLALDVL